MIKSISEVKKNDRRHPVEFDLLCPPKTPRVSIRTAVPADVDRIYGLIEKNVSLTVAPPSVMRFVMSLNRNNIITFCRHGEIVGFYAMMMLNVTGAEAMLLGDLNTRDPSAAHLAPRLTPPAAIYQWLVVAPGMAAEGVMHVSRFLRDPFYRGANLYSRSITPPGARIATALGFRRIDGAKLEGLHRYVRLVNRHAEFARDSSAFPEAA